MLETICGPSLSGTYLNHDEMSRSPTKHNGVEGTQQSLVQAPTSVSHSAPKDPRQVQAQTNRHEHTQLERSGTVLQEFAIQISIITNLEAARDRLQKKVQREVEERAKAGRRGFQFPSGVSNVPDSQEQLAEKEKEVQSHLDVLDQLTQELALIVTSSSHSTSDSAVKSDIVKLQTQVAALLAKPTVDQGLDKSRLAIIEGNIRGLQSKVDSEKCNGLKKISHIESSLKGFQYSISKVESRISTIEQQIANNRSKIDSFNNLSAAQGGLLKLEGKVTSNHETILKELANLRQGGFSDKASLLDTVAKSRADLEAKIASIAVTSEARPRSTPARSSEDLDKLESNQRNLFNQLECLRKIHDDRDAIVAEEIKKIQSSETRLAKDLDIVSQNVGTLRKEIDLLQQQSAPLQTAANTPAPDPETRKQLQDIRDTYDRVQNSVKEQMKVLGIAMHSLQMNFSNLTSEQIARQMVNAVSHMYPLPQMQGEIETICKDIKGLHTFSSSFAQRMETLATKLESQKHALQKANEERGVSIQEMNIERDRLLNQIEALQTRVGHLEKKQQKYATVEHVSLESNCRTAEMTSVKSRQDNMEEITAKKLADALGKIEALEQRDSRLDRMEQEMEFMRRENQRICGDNAELLSVIRRFEPDAREEALARYEEAERMRQEENQQSDQDGERERLGILSRFHARQNGHQSSREPSRSHASSDGSESSASSPARESVPPDAPLDSRASYQPKRRGWHSTTSPPSHPTKRLKRGGGSLHRRVSRG